MSPEIELPAYQVDWLEAFGRERGLTPGEVFGRLIGLFEKHPWLLEPFYRNMPMIDWPLERFKIVKDFMDREMNR